MKYSPEVVQFADDYIDFLNKSKSPWHVVNSVRDELLKYGFVELDLEDEWSMQPKGKYFVIKGGSTLLAFALGGNWTKSSPIAFCAPHTDSPSLRVKPISKRGKLGFLEVGAAQYGGGLWHTWFDKDLGLCGRVFFRNGSKIESKLIHIKKPIAKIPSLAIHFDSTMNTAFTFNHETQLLPVIGLSDDVNATDDIEEKHHPLLLSMLADVIGCAPGDIVEFDLNFTDVEPACIGGANGDFIFGQNQDNQISSFACFRALISAVQSSEFDKLSHAIIYGTYDHEEIGNKSETGASSDFTVQVLKNITSDGFSRAMDTSFALSADVDHAVNPNYESYYEVGSKPLLNGGPAIKYNPRMEFATTGLSAAIARVIAEKANIPVQSSIPINGNRTGSTHGPSLSSLIGITTVDIGPPILAMHSIRETSGTEAVWQMFKYTEAFFLKYGEVLTSFTDMKFEEKTAPPKKTNNGTKPRRYY